MFLEQLFHPFVDVNLLSFWGAGFSIIVFITSGHRQTISVYKKIIMSYVHCSSGFL